MKIDFHVHGKIANSFPFDKEKILLLIEEAKSEGIDSIALTEHSHSKNFLEGYNFLKQNYELIGDYYNVDGFKVFYGMEVTTKQFSDILFIGETTTILKLRENIINTLEKEEEYLDIHKLFSIPIPEDLLVILAHPYRHHEEIPNLEKNIVERLDAIEWNAKDLYKNGIEEMKNKVEKLAEKLSLPITCGSDTHHFIQMGSIKNILKKDCNTVKQIKAEIKANNYNKEISNNLSIRVKSGIIIKKLITNK